jgi:AcrR family transcriptional regulator
LRAGERLFAEHGIHQVRVREINALAGQRNPSALHYHFRTRDGLVEAILSVHQTAMDVQIRPALDALVDRSKRPSVRDIVSVWARAMSAELESQSGRDFLRIVPQVLDMVKRTVRQGGDLWASAQSHRTLALLDACMGELPTAVRRERLVCYAVMLSDLFADRAAQLDADGKPALDAEEFAAYVTDVICGALEAPSTVDAPSTTIGRE